MFMCYICPPSISHPYHCVSLSFQAIPCPNKIHPSSFLHVPLVSHHYHSSFLLQLARIQSLFRKFKGSTHSFWTPKLLIIQWMNAIYQTITIGSTLLHFDMQKLLICNILIYFFIKRKCCQNVPVCEVYFLTWCIWLWVKMFTYVRWKIDIKNINM